MKKGINLTLGRKRVDSALRKMFYTTIVIFFLTVIVSIGLIIYRLILRSSFDALDTKEQKLNEQLLSMQDKRDKFIETKSRLTDIKQILTKRSPITIRVDTVSQVVPADSQVNGLSGDKDELHITLESENLSSLNDLFEQKMEALAMDKKKGIKKIELQAFSLNPKTLMYSTTFGVTFN
jgi:Tfp pilus assembly protein PilN